MSRIWLALALWLLAAVRSEAHLGSPNVVLEGSAGPHALRVVVQPPPTLPGVAQVSVRGEGVDAVSAQVAPAASPTAAAPPVAARAVGPALFHAAVWVWAEGAQIVRIRAQGPAGEGLLAVPLQLRPSGRAPITSAAVAGLVLVGGGLAAAAVAMARRAGGGRAARRAVGGCLAVTLALGWRWQVLDARFAEASESERVPVRAEFVAESPARLRLTPATVPAGWDALAADHGKLMHLFLLRAPQADVFVHLHPARRDAQRFESLLPELPAGRYDLYAEITRQDGRSETLVTQIDLPATPGPVPQPTPPGDAWCRSPLALIRNLPAPRELDRDDSWHVGPAVTERVAPLADGGRMVFATAGRLVSGREVALRFFLAEADGGARPLQLYMGMNGHCVVRRRDGSVFTHLHPSGTVSMAASEIAEQQTASAADLTLPPPAGTEAIFPYVFPRGGEYRLWVQLQAEGRVHTGVFDVAVD